MQVVLVDMGNSVLLISVPSSFRAMRALAVDRTPALRLHSSSVPPRPYRWHAPPQNTKRDHTRASVGTTERTSAGGQIANEPEAF